MSAPRQPSRPPEADPIDVLLTRFAAKLAPLLAPAGEPYYDARTVPAEIGRRLFLEAAAAGEFTSFRVGNRIVARREDVHRWVEGRVVQPSPRTRKSTKKRVAEAAAEQYAEDDAALDAAGLIPRNALGGH